MIVAMLFSELEGSTLDVADQIASRGGTAFLERELGQDDDDRLTAAIGALAASEDPAVDRRGLTLRLQAMLESSSPSVVVTAIDGLRDLGDRTVHDCVLGLLAHGKTELVRAHALIYLRALFSDSALPTSWTNSLTEPCSSGHSTTPTRTCVSTPGTSSTTGA